MTDSGQLFPVPGYRCYRWGRGFAKSPSLDVCESCFLDVVFELQDGARVRLATRASKAEDERGAGKRTSSAEVERDVGN